MVISTLISFFFLFATLEVLTTRWFPVETDRPGKYCSQVGLQEILGRANQGQGSHTKVTALAPARENSPVRVRNTGSGVKKVLATRRLAGLTKVLEVSDVVP
jgi:hypothetical protein